MANQNTKKRNTRDRKVERKRGDIAAEIDAAKNIGDLKAILMKIIQRLGT